MKPSTPDLKKASMSDDGLLAAHKAIYQEVGSKKTLPFHCSEARAWIEHHRIKINHHTVTGRILGHLVRRGLYLQNKVGKTWSMTPFGVEVALGQKPLPADATPKKPGRKKVSAPAAAKPDEGEAMGVVKESPMGELLTLLMLAGDDADNVRKLLKTCQRLNALDEETAVLRAEKETLIKGLYDNSAGVIVKRLEKLRMV